MFACSLDWYCTIRSITCLGIWLEAALSRKTSGFPLTSSPRIGKSSRMRSTSNAPGRCSAALCIAVISRFPLRRRAGLRHHHAFQTLDDRAHRDALDHGGAECVGEKVPRCAVRESAASQVEKLLRVELPDRRAVGAFHVIGENLQLRLGVDRRLVGKQKIPALL